MTDLQGCIRHWERLLKDHQYILEPSTKAIIFLTIKFLKDLEVLKEVSK